jgi:hypothetical protein
MHSGINKFPEDAASGGAPVAGWPRRIFLYGRTGWVAYSDGPFLVQSSYVRRALRRTQPSRQTELAKRICTPLQRKVMVMREKYAVEEVAKSLDKTTAEIDQIEAQGWLKLGSYHLTRNPSHTDEFMEVPHITAGRDTLAMMRDRNIHPDAIT